MVYAAPKQILNTWISATWNEFIVATDRAEIEKIRCYYDAGWMRIESMGVGSGHSQDNTLLSQVVSLYGIVRGVAIKGFTNGSFQKIEEQECQPDMAFYLGSDIPNPFPPKTTEVVDCDRYGPPTLVIEIVATSLNDDLGRKRLLYERLGVKEYWIVDVLSSQIVAFEIENRGSREIYSSQVLPGIAMTTIVEALQRNRSNDDTEVSRWLMQVFSAIE